MIRDLVTLHVATGLRSFSVIRDPDEQRNYLTGRSSNRYSRLTVNMSGPHSGLALVCCRTLSA